MAVNKTLEIVYDLSTLNQEQAGKLIEANEQLIKQGQKEAQKQKQKKKTKKQKEISKKEIAEEFPIEQLSGTKGIDIFVSQFKSAIPFITPILLASGFFISKLLNLSKLNKKFIDIADDRISVFIARQQQALLDSRQIQTIYTITPGSASPRDSYNSFNDFDNAITTNGVERDTSSFGGVD